MVYYFILYMSFILVAFFDFFNSKKASFVFYPIAILLATIVLIFRDMVGGYDLYVYGYYFENILLNGNYYNYELGFYYINLFFSYFFSDRWYLFTLFGLVFLISVIVLGKQLGSGVSHIFVFFVLLKLYFISFTYLRQILAISFYFLALVYLLRGAKLRYILFLFFSSTIHASLILGFLTLFLNKKIINKIYFIVGFFIVLFLGLFLKYFSFFKFIGLESGISLFYFIEAIFLFFIFYSIRGYFEFNKFFLIYNLSIVYIYLCLFSSLFGGNFIRFLWIFSFAPIFCLIYYIMILRYKNPSLSLLYFILMISYLTAGTIKYLTGFDDGVLMDYSTVFDQIKSTGMHSYLEYR